MYLLTPAIVAGFLAGAGRAWINKRAIHPLDLRWQWLVMVAVWPQLLAFYIPTTRHLVADSWAAIILCLSQMLLLVFIWANRQQPYLKLLGLGLALNLLVILLNNGLMPVSPEALTQLAPQAPSGGWVPGERIEKDVVLPLTETKLWWLSDHLLVPTWFPYQAVFSPGDMLIAMGVFGLLRSIGNDKREKYQHA